MDKDKSNSWGEFAYDFDAVFADVSTLANDLRCRARNRIVEALGLGEAATDSVQIVTSGKDIEIIFSQQIAEKLRTGELTLPIDKRTGLNRVDARDAHHRIQEPGKVRTATPALRTAINTVTSAAHIISAIDVQAQLQEISQKIDRLVTFIRGDRQGELRGAYNEFIRLLHSSSSRREEELRQLNSRLGDLSARFFQTAYETLREMRDPSKISAWEALTTSQSTVEKTLTEALQNAQSDLRAAEFCWFLRTVIFSELDQPEELLTHQRIVQQQLERLRPLFVERTGYWSIEMRNAIDEKLKRQITSCPERAVDDIVLLSQGDPSDG